MAVPPSLSVSVGVPPGYRHRLAQIERQCHSLAGIEVACPGGDPGSRSHHRRYRRRRGVDLQRAGGVGHGAGEIGGIAGAISDGRRVLIDRRDCKVGRILAGTDRIAEGQRAGAGAAGIGGRATVVEGQCRRAPRYSNRLAHSERQRHHVAGIKVARAVADPGSRSHHRRYRRRRGIDLRAALGQADKRQVGGIAGTISDGRRIEIDRRRHQVRRVLPSRNHIAEGQRTGAGPAAIGCRAAVIERQRRRAARYSNRLAHGECQRHRLAGVKVAVQRRFRYPHHRRYRGVDLQGAGRVGHRTREVGGIAGAVGDADSVPVPTIDKNDSAGRVKNSDREIGGIGIDRRDRKVGRVLAGTDRIAEGQRAGAGAAGIGGRAAVIERQCRRAAGYRHRLAQIERQGHHGAGIKVAGAIADPSSRSHNRRYRRCRSIDLQYAGGVGHRTREVGDIAGTIGNAGGIGVDRGDGKVGRVLASRNRIAEGQRAGAGTAAIGGRAAVVERQCRRAAGDSNRLAHGERQRHRLAGIKIAGTVADPGARHQNRRYCRRHSADLQGAGGVGHRAREVGGIAGAVGDGRRVLIDRRYREIGRVLSGTDRIAEGQRAGAGAAGIGRGAAIIERQRRRATGDRHGLSKVERQGYHAAGVKIASAVADPGTRSHHR